LTIRYNAHAHGSIAGGDTAHGKGGHSTALQMLGDPFRVEGWRIDRKTVGAWS